MSIKALVLAALTLSTLAACSAEMAPGRDIKAPGARVVGEPVNCLPLAQIQNTRVHDDYTIDFEATGGKLYRNTLPNRCPNLGFEEAFTYETSIGRLCSTDIIYVLRTGGHGPERGAACGLGEFVPIELSAN